MPSQYKPVAADKRLKKTTGNYNTRAELIAACEEYASMGLKHESIAKHVGVAECTVQRILSALKKPAEKIKVLKEHRETQQIDDTPVTAVLRDLYRQWKPTELPEEITTAEE